MPSWFHPYLVRNWEETGLQNATGSAPRRGPVLAVAAAVTFTVAMIAWYLISYVFGLPPTVDAHANGRGTAITLQTVAATGHAPHPDWVSYYAMNPSGKWVHGTILKVPAHSTVTVTVINFDGMSGLRNPFLSQPRGTIGSVSVNGKPLRVMNPDEASHTFTIPRLGVSVPILGVGDNAPNQCDVPAPCPMSTAHTTTTFTIKTGKPGWYRWQCFVPCGAGWIFGNGGPMQTVGYLQVA
jgi:hypothetical protein